MIGRRRGWPLLALIALGAGCSAGHVEGGVFRSAKGYRVTVPPAGWSVASETSADLELRRTDPPGGIAVAATCEGSPLRRPLPVLMRHLTFGLSDRQVLERGAARAGPEPGERQVLRGRLDGVEVMVEAVVARDDRCVYDFLYVSPPEHFAAGRPVFEALVQSFATSTPP